MSTKQPLKAVHGSNSKDTIRFYNYNDPYYEFTNFYRASIDIDDKIWLTSEHYFQAQKFIGTPYVEMVRNASTSREAFQMSRDANVSKWCRSDWDQVKDNIMMKAILCKFMQHQDLGRKLVATGNKLLVEHTTNDSYWGDGGDGSGLNKLGELLMKVRSKLQETGNYSSSIAQSDRSGSFTGRPLHAFDVHHDSSKAPKVYPHNPVLMEPRSTASHIPAATIVHSSKGHGSHGYHKGGQSWNTSKPVEGAGYVQGLRTVAGKFISRAQSHVQSYVQSHVQSPVQSQSAGYKYPHVSITQTTPRGFQRHGTDSSVKYNIINGQKFTQV